jgi:hypothetical protein
MNVEKADSMSRRLRLTSAKAVQLLLFVLLQYAAFVGEAQVILRKCHLIGSIC